MNSSQPVHVYEITNALGQKIASGIYGKGITTETLSQGIYFIQISTESGEKIKLKFVKE